MTLGVFCLLSYQEERDSRILYIYLGKYVVVRVFTSSRVWLVYFYTNLL